MRMVFREGEREYVENTRFNNKPNLIYICADIYVDIYLGRTDIGYSMGKAKQESMLG